MHHIKLHLQCQVKRYFAKKCKVFAPAGVATATAASRVSFSCLNGPYAGFIYLEMAATTAADFHLRYISSNLTFSCIVMPFLCFLGALPASVVALHVDPLCYSRLQYWSKHEEKYARPARDHFLLRRAISWSHQLLMQRKCVTRHFMWAQHDSNRRWLRNYYSGTVGTTVDCMQLCLNTDLYFCLHFTQLRMAQCLFA